jgi:F-type H+-transporting ATPase subunit a
MSKVLRKLLLICLLVPAFLVLNANEQADTSKVSGEGHKKEAFNAGEFILDHILDSHEWHICTIFDHHIVVPLPIIVYSKTSGLNIFLSSKFEHGHASYKGFSIPKEGVNKGNVIETLPNGTEVKPLDLSLTKVAFSIMVSAIFILVIFISVARKYQRNPNTAPSGMQSLLEVVILFVRDDIAKASIGEKRYEKFLPYLLTLFFFILFNNLMGLIPFFPFGANVTGNIAVTMIMAVCTFFISTLSTNKSYWSHIVNTPGVPWWLKLPVPLMPLIELLGFINKPIVLMIRLFANMTAGHLIAMSLVGLIFIFGNIHPVAGYGMSIFSAFFYVFMGLLEVLVALIQAYVFTFLSALYFGMAKVEEHH